MTPQQFYDKYIKSPYEQYVRKCKVRNLPFNNNPWEQEKKKIF